MLAFAGIKACPAAPTLLRADRFGRPELSIGSGQPAAVSFSWQADRLWTALSSQCPRLGMDAALCADFGDGYPFAKVFNEREWKGISALLDASVARGASFLWSAKEAAVKMVGWGFGFVQPGHISVTISKSRGNLLESRADIASRAWTGKVNIYSIEHPWGWLSFAPG